MNAYCYQYYITSIFFINLKHTGQKFDQQWKKLWKTSGNTVLKPMLSNYRFVAKRLTRKHDRATFPVWELVLQITYLLLYCWRKVCAWREALWFNIRQTYYASQPITFILPVNWRCLGKYFRLIVWNAYKAHIFSLSWMSEAAIYYIFSVFDNPRYTNKKFTSLLSCYICLTFFAGCFHGLSSRRITEIDTNSNNFTTYTRRRRSWRWLQFSVDLL